MNDNWTSCLGVIPYSADIVLSAKARKADSNVWKRNR